MSKTDKLDRLRAERLKKTVDEKMDSIRRFHREMERRLGQDAGASYANVHRYLKGETTPSPQFFLEAAQLLEVDPLWLLGEKETPDEPGLPAMLQEQKRYLSIITYILYKQH